MKYKNIKIAEKLIYNETIPRKDIANKEDSQEIIDLLEIKIQDIKRVIRQLKKY